MNITYLFGAGASYNAIPVVGELEKAFEQFHEWAEIQLGPLVDSNSNSSIDRGYKLFLEQLNQCAYRSRVFGTIDTYAKTLALNENTHDLSMLKSTLSLFFTLWQELQLKNTAIEKVRTKNSKNEKYLLNDKGFQDIDSRYITLLTNYLQINREKTDKKPVILNTNVKFLTWNYDTQLERALALISGNNLNDVLENYSIHPTNQISSEEIPDIVHLNGIAGYYETENSKVSLFKEANPEGGLNFKNLLKEKLYFIDSTEKRTVNTNNFLHFAWENNNVAKKGRDYAIKILEKTDVLIVVGYSFPDFNLEVDIELFNALKINGREDFKIIYQDLNANQEIITRNFGIDPSKIEIENKNLNKFILPLERR